MVIKTTRFGTLEIDEESVVTFPDGLLGISHLRQYAILSDNDKSPFRWLQSLEDPAMAFLLIDPWLFRPDYGPVIDDDDALALEIGPETPRIVYAIVTIPPGKPEAMTANLMGPIVINIKTRIGRQVIVANSDEYTTKHSILTEMHLGAAQRVH